MGHPLLLLPCWQLPPCNANPGRLTPFPFGHPFTHRIVCTPSLSTHPKKASLPSLLPAFTSFFPSVLILSAHFSLVFHTHFQVGVDHLPYHIYLFTCVFLSSIKYSDSRSCRQLIYSVIKNGWPIVYSSKLALITNVLKQSNLFVTEIGYLCYFSVHMGCGGTRLTRIRHTWEQMGDSSARLTCRQKGTHLLLGFLSSV